MIMLQNSIMSTLPIHVLWQIKYFRNENMLKIPRIIILSTESIIMATRRENIKNDVNEDAIWRRICR